ncbi:MAG TPA: hypothetical protein VEI02_10440 [Planctomycetota bacterium]|nr:hypothetical protein [Planctomycetota bacterium]
MSIPLEELPLIALLVGLLVVVPSAFVIAARKRRRDLPTPCVVVRRPWSIPAAGASPSLAITDLALLPGVRGATAPIHILVRAASPGPASTLRVLRLPGPEEIPSIAATRTPRVVRVDPGTWRIEVVLKAGSRLRLAVSDGGDAPPEISADEGVAMRPIPAAEQIHPLAPEMVWMWMWMWMTTMPMSMSRSDARVQTFPIALVTLTMVAVAGVAAVMIIVRRHAAVGRTFQRLAMATDGPWATVEETAAVATDATSRRETAVVGAP